VIGDVEGYQVRGRSTRFYASHNCNWQWWSLRAIDEFDVGRRSLSACINQNHCLWLAKAFTGRVIHCYQADTKRIWIRKADQFSSDILAERYRIRKRTLHWRLGGQINLKCGGLY